MPDQEQCFILFYYGKEAAADRYGNLDYILDRIGESLEVMADGGQVSFDILCIYVNPDHLGDPVPPVEFGQADKRTFIYFDDGIGQAVVTGDIPETLEYIRTVLAEMDEDTGFELEFKREDMTEAELEALPVI